MSKRNKKSPEIVLNDSDKLVLFLHRMRELQERTYFKRNFIEESRSGPLEKALEEDTFAAFLLSFRHFYAQNEPTEVAQIHGLLQKAAKMENDEWMMSALDRIRMNFQNAPDPGGTVRFEDGQPAKLLKGADVRTLFINSNYFHNDVRGFQFLYQLPEAELDKAREQFRQSLVRYITRLREYVPLASEVLERGVFPEGVFRVRQAEPENKSDPARRGIVIRMSSLGRKPQSESETPKD